MYRAVKNLCLRLLSKMRRRDGDSEEAWRLFSQDPVYLLLEVRDQISGV